MKQLGLRPVKFQSKTDYHVKKDGLKNFWEDMGFGGKSADRIKVKKQIKEGQDLYKEEKNDLY